MVTNLLFSIFRKPIKIYPLATFRVVFGFLMLLSTVRFIYLGWIEDHFINTTFQFKYYGLDWVTLPSPFLVYILHVLLLLASLLFLIGLYYRFAAIVQFFSFTYLQLIDLTYYLNHYYFVSLICGIMIFLPAANWCSLDVKFGNKKAFQWVEAWTINLLKFQIALVYIYAGLAKISATWLFDALPLRIWLPAKDTIPILGSLFSHEYAPLLFSWAGMFYDIFIIFFLIFPRTRLIAWLMVVAFHSIVGILFQIGVFPVVMIGITLIFFSDSWHWKWQNLILKNRKTAQGVAGVLPRLGKPVLLFYIFFQLAFPWRFLFYSGSLLWREEGYRFSWRVMLIEKAGTAIFKIKDGKTGRIGYVDNREFLNPHQEKQMAFQPDMILQFAHFLGRHFKAKGVHSPEVYVDAVVTLNGSPGKQLIDPNTDLMKVNDGWQRKQWVLD